MAEIKQEERKMTKVELAKKIDAMKERDQELVTGIFRYIEKPRQTLRFRFKKYPGEEFVQYEMKDGERYRIPRSVARHLNQNCYYVEYNHLDGKFANAVGQVHAASTARSENEQSKMYGVTKIYRTEFRSLEFMDDDISAKPNIMEVAYL